MTAVTPHPHRHTNRRSGAIQNWHDANQQFLSQSLEQVRKALIESAADQGARLNNQLREALNDDLHAGGVLGSTYDGQPFTLELLARTFDLNKFELSILLLCAGMELDGQWARLCQAVNGLAYPTFGLALSIFKEASWEVITPSGTLRRLHLIDVGKGETLVNSPLRLDERILHYLTGVQYLDQRLQPLMIPMRTANAPLPAQVNIAEQIVSVWTQRSLGEALPAVQLSGEDATCLQAIACETCHQLGLTLQTIPADALPADWQQLKLISTLCEREYQLSHMAVLLYCETLAPGSVEKRQIITSFINGAHFPVFILSGDRYVQQQRAILSFYLEAI